MRIEMSRVDCDVKSGCLKQPGAAGAVGTLRIGWEAIIQLKPVMGGLNLGPPYYMLS